MVANQPSKTESLISDMFKLFKILSISVKVSSLRRFVVLLCLLSSGLISGAQPSDVIFRYAKAGNSYAQYELGRRYMTGEGLCEADTSAAFSWLFKSAMQFNDDALFYLLYCYNLGNLSKKENLEGNDTVLFVNGYCYYQYQDNLEKEYDYDTLFSSLGDLYLDSACFYLEKSSQMGNMVASAFLADIKLKKKDTVSAIEYYEKAAKKGDVESQIRLYEILFERDKFWESKLLEEYPAVSQWQSPPMEKSEYEERALDSIYNKYLFAGKWDSIYLVCDSMSKTGNRRAEFYKAVSQMQAGTDFYDPYSAYRIFSTLAMTDNRDILITAQAQYFLGVCYWNAVGVPLDYDEALFWFNKASDNGSIDARCIIGEMLMFGRNFERDSVKAIRLLSTSTLAGRFLASQYYYNAYKDLVQINSDKADCYLDTSMLILYKVCESGAYSFINKILPLRYIELYEITGDTRYLVSSRQCLNTSNADSIISYYMCDARSTFFAGDAQSVYYAGLCLLFGDSNCIPSDTARAIELLSRACDLGCVEAEHFMTSHYLYGGIVEKDKEKAKELMLKIVLNKNTNYAIKSEMLYDLKVLHGLSLRTYSDAMRELAKYYIEHNDFSYVEEMLKNGGEEASVAENILYDIIQNNDDEASAYKESFRLLRAYKFMKVGK